MKGKKQRKYRLFEKGEEKLAGPCEHEVKKHGFPVTRRRRFRDFLLGPIVVVKL